MIKTYVYQPTYFFVNSFIITSIFWFGAAYISYQQSLQYLLFPLILAGMAGPSVSAFIMFVRSRDKKLWDDFCQRLRLSKIKISFIPIILFCVPLLIIAAILLSLLFDFSVNQLLLFQDAPDQALEGTSFLVILMIVLLSCSLEEIGWRGYGIDSLNSKYNLWNTSLIFAALWSLWHVPAFFIKNGYFQQELLNLGSVYVITYFVSLFPITMLLNWLYIKNNRSILVAILFHTVMNITYGILHIELFTKIVFMLLLILVAGIVVLRDKETFFKGPKVD